jgi:hypothetical protein
MSVMTEPGETEGHIVADRLVAIRRHAAHDPVPNRDLVQMCRLTVPRAVCFLGRSEATDTHKDAGRRGVAAA